MHVLNRTINILINSLLLLFLPCTISAQIINHDLSDTSKYTQYRRGIALLEGYQTYEQKYANKNIIEEKRRLFPLQSTGVWTELNPKVPRVTYVGIHFVNKDTGWAAGDLGTLIKTTDGGSNYTLIETNTTTPILKVRSFNGQIVIASGYDGLILRSTDGGNIFTQVISGVGSGFDLWGLEMINDTLGLACGATALLKTTDAGLNWEIVNTPGYTGNLWWIDFMNEDYGFVAGDGKILRTIDGGSNWEIIQAGDNQALYCVDVIDSLHIAAAGYGGTSYPAKNIYSSDGGYTWTNGGFLTTENVNVVKYVNRDTGYVIMNNVIGWKTTNRGQHWTGMAIGGEWEMQLFENDNFGYSAGTELRIYKTENGYENWQRIIINDNFSDVFFVNEQKGFAISSSAFSASSGLYETTDSGLNWQKYPSGLNGVDLLFLDSLTGFIGSNQIYKTTDGGLSWYVPNGGQGGAGKIFFINETTGWAVRSNVIYITTDRGENWFTQFTAPFGSFTNIYFVDSLYGWVSGTRPYKTTDGGNNWVQQTNTNIWLSNDVYFSNIDTGWIAKRSSINPSLYKTTDSGSTWLPIPITEVTGAASFYLFPDVTHWIISGSIIQSYIIYKTYITYNSGNSWIDITGDVPSGFNSFNAVTNKLGFAVGGLGLILRYDDTSYVPVELISFQGKSFDNEIILNWQTASEINNQGFEIQRSEVRDQKSDWEVIGFVNGKVTTSEQQFYTYIDNELNTGVYRYRLRQIDFDGSFEYSEVIEVEIGSPSEFYLSQNYPNPFNPETNIGYKVPVKTFVKISLYDIKGENVRELVNEEKQPGYYTLKLKGGKLSSGIYFYRLITSSGYTAVKKLIIIK
jgi:photosystem II stability/assembly factor-like uncharacterized protein